MMAVSAMSTRSQFQLIKVKPAAAAGHSAGEYAAHVAAGSLTSFSAASLSVDYALDFFGGTRRNIESLEAQTEFQRFEIEAAYLSLTANVVTAAVQRMLFCSVNISDTRKSTSG